MQIWNNNAKKRETRGNVHVSTLYSCICYYGIMITGKSCNGKFQQIWAISILKIKSCYLVKLPITTPYKSHILRWALYHNK